MVRLALFPDVVVLSSVVGKVDRFSFCCNVFLVFLIVNNSAFSQHCLCCSYVPSHVYHFVNWTLLERCTAV